MKKYITIVAIAATVLTACNSKTMYDCEGTFESTEIIVSAEAMGRILSLDVKEGDSVKAGEMLGCVDTVQLCLTRLQMVKNSESLKESRPDVRKQIDPLEEQLAKLETEKARIERLLADGAATQKQLDDINSEIEMTRKQIDAQKSSLQNSVSSLNAQSSSVEMQIAQIEDQLAKCRITSPVDGTVLTKYAEAGEYASAGKPLFKVADLSTVYLRAYLTTAQLAEVRLGQEVSVYADYGGGNTKAYDGTITWISSKSEFTPKNIQTDDERENLVYAVKVAVENDGLIKLGMYGGLVLSRKD